MWIRSYLKRQHKSSPSDKRLVGGTAVKTHLRRIIWLITAVLCFVIISCLEANCEEAKVIVYSQPEGLEGSEHYAVFVNGFQSFAYITRRSNRVNNDQQTATFTGFSFEGNSVSVEVTVLDDREIESVIVRPTDLGIKPEVDGKTVRFELAEPAYVSVEFNGDTTHKCFIFADEPETDIPDINAENVWYFAPGVYDIGNADIPEGKDTIYIAGGAYIRGQISSNFAKRGELRILGRGIFSGENNEHQDMGHLISVKYAQRFIIDGPILVDSNSFHMDILGTKATADSPNVVHNLKEIAWVSYTDGFHIDKYIDVDNVFIYNYDDALDICQYSAGGTVKNCVIWNNNYGSALLLGWVAVKETGNVVVENIDVIHFNENDTSAFNNAVIMANHGEKGKIGNICINDLHVESFDGAVNSLFSIRINKSPWSSSGTPYGSISNIHISDVRTDGDISGNVIMGQDEEHMVADILLENITVNGKIIPNLAEMHILRNEYTKSVRYAHSYVMNGSFEHSDGCWIRDGDAQIVDLYITTNGIEQAKNGHAIMQLKCRKAEASTVYQEINDIPDGEYKLTAYVKAAGEGLEACMYIRTSEIEYRTDIENTEDYTRITAKNIVVSGGKCTIGFSVCGPEDSVVYIDQVVFEKTS